MPAIPSMIGPGLSLSKAPPPSDPYISSPIIKGAENVREAPKNSAKKQLPLHKSLHVNPKNTKYRCINK